MNSKITLYPSNWLYNAGVVGFLRVLEFGRGEEYVKALFKEDGGVEITPGVFENFEKYYFEYTAKHYLMENFSLYSIREETQKAKIKKIVGEGKLKEMDLRIKNEENRVKNEFGNLRPYLNWEDFFINLHNILEYSKRNVLDIIKACGDILTSKVESFYKEISNGMKNFKTLSDFWGRFYFNKGVIANPKGERPERMKRFKEKYVLNALKVFEKNASGIYTCTLCGREFEEPKYLTEINEGDFSITGISSQKFANFYKYYLGEKESYPLKCHLCQIILLCAFAGFNRKPWQIKEVDDTEYIFINYPYFEEVFNINNRFKNELQNLELGILGRNIYYRAMEIVLDTVKKKTRWTLENILFVEIKPSVRKDQNKPIFLYFNIDRAFAELFEEFKQIEKYFNLLSFSYEVYKNIRIFLSTETLKRMLNKKPILPIAFKYSAELLSENKKDFSSVWAMITLEFILREKIKSLKGGKSMQAKTLYGILKSIEEAGAKSFGLDEIDQNKRFSIAQRMLTLIRGGRKEDFYEQLLHIFIAYKKPIPDALKSLLSESDVTSFQEKALAFLTGFVNPYKEKKEEKHEK